MCNLRSSSRSKINSLPLGFGSPSPFPLPAGAHDRECPASPVRRDESPPDRPSAPPGTAPGGLPTLAPCPDRPRLFRSRRLRLRRVAKPNGSVRESASGLRSGLKRLGAPALRAILLDGRACRGGPHRRRDRVRAQG